MHCNDFFGSKFPIVCLPMNGVSNLALAVAVSNAGGFPSLALQMYVDQQNQFDLNRVFQDLEQFAETTKSTNLLFSVREDCLAIPQVLEIFKKVTHCELLGRPNLPYSQRIQNIDKIKSYGCRVLLKTQSFVSDLSIFDGVIFKSSDGAGRIDPTADSLETTLKKYRDLHPKKAIVPSGGISNSQQVKTLLDNGADAVGIGTLFALSEESCVSKETKLKLVSSSSQDIEHLPTNSSMLNAVIFSKVNDNDLHNHTPSLLLGIKSPNWGHIPMGKGLDQVNSILPVKVIIENLMS